MMENVHPYKQFDVVETETSRCDSLSRPLGFCGVCFIEKNGTNFPRNYMEYIVENGATEEVFNSSFMITSFIPDGKNKQIKTREMIYL